MGRAGCFLFIASLLLLAPPSVLSQSVRVITPEELKKFQPKSVEKVGKQQPKKSPAKYSAMQSRAPSGKISTVAPKSKSDSDSGLMELSKGQYYLIESYDPEREVDCGTLKSNNCTETPFRFLTMTDEGESIDLSLVFNTSSELRFDRDENLFVGKLFVQLRDMNEPNQAKSIGSRIRVAVSAEVDQITPEGLLEFDETNRFKDIAFAVHSPQDPTIVTLTPEESAAERELEFYASRPGLIVSLGKEKILGFGLETTTVNIQVDGVEEAPKAAITVTSETGHLEQNTVLVNVDSRIASTRIRSRGTGKDSVTVELTPFEPGSAEIYYERPWSWLIAVILGIILGIGIRLAMRARQDSPSSSIPFNVAISICGGIVTAVLYALGVNILPVSLPSGFSEGLTFMLSALGGWVFPAWLEALGKRPDQTAV